MPEKNTDSLEATDASHSTGSKRRPEDDTIGVSAKRGRGNENEDDTVDYGEEVNHAAPQPVASETQVHLAQEIMVSPEEEEKARITRALESWCNNNIAMDKDDPDANDRVAALAEVGLLLVFDLEKYPNADSMRSELQDIGSIIGGDLVVTRYINFILSLQNQLKKTRAQAERHMRQQQHMMGQFPGGPFPFPHPGGMMPMMMHPSGQPMFVPGQQMPMFMGGHGFPMQQPMGSQQLGRGNLTFNATGEMTAVQKQREKEKKRKEILAECTEHLKALLERAMKTTDSGEKAKIYELIDKVKKRIESLKEVVPSPPAPSKAAAPKGPVRGYYSNQYINPKLLEQQKTDAHTEGEQ